MDTLGPAVVAFVISTAISWLELITAKYPRTYFLLLRNRALWLYGLIYGAIAFGILLGLDALINAEAIRLEGLGFSSPWVRAIAVGVTIKALLHINLFNVRVGSQPVPIGIETIVQLFEPELLRTILLDEFNAVRQYIQPFATQYPDLNVVKERIKINIPPTLPLQERAAFENEVDKANTVIDAMERFLRFLGRGTFERVFPL